MKTENYEKPAMKFVSLQNKESIAETCWGFHGSDTKFYYDTEGTGWVSFQIGDGPCTLNLIKVTYYQNKDDSTGTLLNPEDPKYQELYAALLNTGGGSNGNPYKGMGTTIIQDDPSPSWS